MKKTKGFSLIELLIVVAVILVIAAIAIPNLLRARIAANEASAVNSIRTLTTAETAYASAYPTMGYTCALSELGPPPSGQNPGPTAAGIIDSVLASTVKAGYNFSLSNCGSVTPRSMYQSGAVPVSVGTSGTRSFCSDASGIIYQALDGTVTTCRSANVALQ